ncbi:uncharacterized protein METZ01_LOCUS8793 [marine metagenome]|uniref:DUF1249 domain-containing protein n=1 Tax=marine metagenome TaxID=408172 RepID=A0A381NNK6_9ZZZZ
MLSRNVTYTLHLLQANGNVKVTFSSVGAFYFLPREAAVRIHASKTKLYGSVRQPPRYKIDLVEHMAECDQNYARVIKLFPDHAEADHRDLLLCFGEEVVNVRMSVLERSRYTSVILLKQEASFMARSNSIRIRVYHDAKSAEVIEIQNQRRFEAIYDYPNPKMRQRDEKKQINRFLGEFLGFCLTYGASSEIPYERAVTIR